MAGAVSVMSPSSSRRYALRPAFLAEREATPGLRLRGRSGVGRVSYLSAALSAPAALRLP